MPASTSPPSTIVATSSSAATLPSPTTTCWKDAANKCAATKAHIGIATDGDADRFGIVDADGTFFTPNYIVALLFDYLVDSRGWKNGVAKSVATTNLINAVAKHHGIELHETPVGFKYIGELIKQDKIAIGGEESAGLSIRHHVPEKDGVLAGLLCCEMVARRGKSLGQQLKELFAEVGSFYSLRENFHLTPEVKAEVHWKVTRRAPRSHGPEGHRGRTHRRLEAAVRRWLLGLLPLVGHRTRGPGIF